MPEWIRRIRLIRSESTSPTDVFVLRMSVGITLAALILILSLFG